MEIPSNQSALLPSAHIIKVLPELTRWKCKNCGCNFKSLRNLVLHQGEVKEKVLLRNPYLKFPIETISCIDCGRKFETEQGLKQHMGKRHKEEKKSVCIYCNKSFKHKHAVKFHINQVHQKSTRVDCKYCKKSYYNVYVMKKHSKKCKSRFPLKLENK